MDSRLIFRKGDLKFIREMRKTVWLALFSISFAYVEAATVVYLRNISGRIMDIFPMKMLNPELAVVEVGRELATIVILVAVAVIARKSLIERFYAFLFLFGLWDIFYYIWLKVFIGWPRGLFEMDILFLIPLPWIGPVIAPVLLALIFVIAGIVVMFRKRPFIFDGLNWGLFLLGSLISIFNFLLPALSIVRKSGLKGLETLTISEFNWGLYWPGLILLALALFLPFIRRTSMENQHL